MHGGGWTLPSLVATIPRPIDQRIHYPAGCHPLARSRRFLDGLNPQQREAARTTDGPVLVLAGAGSGKTRVITQRIAHILHNQLAEPSEVLAVTFTNKAAAEMRERVSQLIGKGDAKPIVISTFHSYCLKVLRQHAERIGIRKNFSIAGESDARTLLRRVVDELNTHDTGYSPGTFQSAISLAKNRCEAPGETKPGLITRETQVKYEEQLPAVYEKYESALRAANSLDFDDLLLQTLRLWERDAVALDLCRSAFKFIMVDEYQDTNAVQYGLLRKLAEEHRNLCVVGDDDQSIYAWRGADPKNILEFERDYPEAKIITLDQNYRSTETILNAANAVIGNNSVRREKKLWSALGKGRAIDWITVADEDAEAKEALKWLRYIQEKTGARYRDFAFLYRSNQQSRIFEITLRQAGIPYVVVGGQDFFERTEVRDIISYLKVISNPRDEAAFLRVVNMPRRGIGDVTLHRVHDLCRERKCSLGQALHTVLQEGDAPKQAVQGIRQFLGLLQRYRERFKEGSTLREALEGLVTDIDYHGELERNSRGPQQALARWQNVEAVVNAVAAYEENTETPTLAGFLDESHLNADPTFNNRDKRKQAGVTLMTVHSAKGLEFPFVFVVGCEEGLLPHENAIRDNTLDEERRLFYVALTRAKRHATLFETISRVRHGKERPAKTSRFLEEIPADLLKRHFRAQRDMGSPAPQG